MDALAHFSIPVKGLGLGTHHYNFTIERTFFEQFEESMIKDGVIDLRVAFDKRSDMYVLDFEFDGTVRTNCDRCLDEMDLAIGGEEQLLVKLSVEERVEEAEVVYVSPELSKFNIAKYIYEFISLAMPLIKVHEDESLCNPEMIAYLNGTPSEDESEEGAQTNPIWEELKKFKSDS